MFVVVAVAADEADDTAAELWARGATAVEVKVAAANHLLLYGRVADDVQATRLVEELRRAGRAAVARPVGGGHLTAWLNHTRPIVIADRLWVCFPWSEFDRSAAPAVVEIDPGRAFGTGGHPSTRLLLTELVRRVRGGESVLDVGCGSGVLSVSAARLGAASVTAIDVKPTALDQTRDNALRNGLARRVHVGATSLVELTGVFDVILANIGASALIELAPALQGRLAERGWLGLSGLSPAQVSVVAAAYPQLRVASLPTEDDWAAVVAGRGPQSA